MKVAEGHNVQFNVTVRKKILNVSRRIKHD